MAVSRRSKSRSRDSDRMDRDPDDNPFNKPGFIASAFIGLIVVIGLMAVLLGNGDENSPTSRSNTTGGSAAGSQGGSSAGSATDGVATGAPDPAAAAAVPPQGAGQCPFLAATDTTTPVEAPPGVEWELYRTVLLPSSGTDGPAVVQGGLARCYAHTPTGALMAAAQISTRYVVAIAWSSVAEYQLAPGTGRDAYVSEREADEDTYGVAGAPEPGDMRQISGFRFISYTQDTAVIELLRRATGGSVVGSVHTLVWQGGDWKLQLEPDGSDASIVEGVDSMSGFATWSAT